MGQPQQLHMVKLNMSDIPEANIPDGFELRVLKPDEKTKWENICNQAFTWENHFSSIIEEKAGYVEDGVFVIVDGDKIIATGTALCTHEHPDGYGYVHMIAVDKNYSGKKLGYEITAAVLRRLRDDGFEKAELNTDDFRIPAIKSYCKLGFIPDLSCDETIRERWEKIYAIFGWELKEYI
jgi:mycothiol synthase